MIYWDQVTIIFFLINFCIVIWMLLGYYYYKKYYLSKIGMAEPDFADGLGELFENFSKGISESLNSVKTDFDLDKISGKLTEQFFGTFLAILGVSEEYDENWSFKSYIAEIIDSSVVKIVPETVAEFEKILPEFADQFIKGIQEALTGAVTGMPDTPEGPSPTQPNIPLPNMDISKMIQMMFMQYIMKQMGGLGGLGGLTSSLGMGTAPASQGPSGF